MLFWQLYVVLGSVIKETHKLNTVVHEQKWCLYQQQYANYNDCKIINISLIRNGIQTPTRWQNYSMFIRCQLAQYQERTNYYKSYHLLLHLNPVVTHKNLDVAKMFHLDVFTAGVSLRNLRATAFWQAWDGPHGLMEYLRQGQTSSLHLPWKKTLLMC